MDDVDTARRLEALEVKAAFAEDLLDHLNALVARQQESIEMLVREIARLREQAGAAQDGAPRSLRDELAAHD